MPAQPKTAKLVKSAPSDWEFVKLFVAASTAFGGEVNLHVSPVNAARSDRGTRMTLFFVPRSASKSR